jgi:hypothetical protein
MSMRRWLMVFLLLVVPAQLIWAAAAPYCGHETSATSKRHFGHHEHRHQADGQAAALNADDSSAAGAFHADCEVCHLGASAVLPVPAVTLGVPPVRAPHHAPPQRYASHIPRGPERPDRADAPAAVRFGGDVVSVLPSS